MWLLRPPDLESATPVSKANSPPKGRRPAAPADVAGELGAALVDNLPSLIPVLSAEVEIIDVFFGDLLDDALSTEAPGPTSPDTE